jgi:hypothetical protein
MTTDEDRPTGADSATGGHGGATANPEPGQASRVGDHGSGQFDAGDFVIDHDVDPPEEAQPTTTV